MTSPTRCRDVTHFIEVDGDGYTVRARNLEIADIDPSPAVER